VVDPGPVLQLVRVGGTPPPRARSPALLVAILAGAVAAEWATFRSGDATLAIVDGVDRRDPGSRWLRGSADLG
jgi:hypothetical protein